MIYLDHAATTRVNEDVYKAMQPYIARYYGNPSGAGHFAGEGRKAVEQAREAVAGFIGANPEEIFFTSGGSESDNWAIKGTAFAMKDKGRHIIISAIEHHAVLRTCQYLEKQGFEVSIVGVDERGIVKLDELKQAIRKDTILISVMFANNEIGTIQPVAEIGELARRNGIIFHTDAVQAYGHERIDVAEMNIDLLSASGHKSGAPKGTGILYIRNGVSIDPLIHGGSQERGRRGGTLNTPGIVGFGAATVIAERNLEERQTYIRGLRNHLIYRILTEIPYVRLNGDRNHRLAGNASFSFQFVESESLLILLEEQGICVAGGAACTSGSAQPSHVLLAEGLTQEEARGTLRITLSDDNTAEEIDQTADKIKEAVQILRNMNPLYQEFQKSGK